MPDYIVHKAVEPKNISAKVRASLSKITDWIISPKYDGCHAVVCFIDGQPLGVYSRTGEVVRSMDHVAIELLKVYPWLAQAGRIAVCGEAWMQGTDFNVISGTFRRHEPQPQLGFVPFDCVPFDFNDGTFDGAPILLGQKDKVPDDRSYTIRITSLSATYPLAPSKIVFYPTFSHHTCSYEAALEKVMDYGKVCKGTMHNQYDGAILANAHGRYCVGSGSGGEFIKGKPLVSFTVTVTGAELAKGEKTGKNTAALTFTLADKPQRVATGLTQGQVDNITEDTAAWVGCRIEVEAMGVTVNGLLREPRFKGIRSDA